MQNPYCIFKTLSAQHLQNIQNPYCIFQTLSRACFLVENVGFEPKKLQSSWSMCSIFPQAAAGGEKDARFK